jgi:hypothetical protein
MAKDWKAALLSSGVPLEAAAARMMNRGQVEVTEYRYWRYDREKGRDSVFSVDLHVAYGESPGPAIVDLFVECKYRHDSVEWFLGRAEHLTPEGGGFRPNWPSLHGIGHLATQLINHTRTSDFVRGFTACRPGIEILANGDRNQAAIDHALGQLAYATATAGVARLEDQLTARMRDYTVYPVFILPVVLTTAKLWILKSGVGVQDVRNAARQEDVADEVSQLAIRREPDIELARHTRDRLNKAFGVEERERLAGLLAEQGQTVSYLFDVFARLSPGLFLVVQLDTFEDFLGSVFDCFLRPESVEPAG